MDKQLKELQKHFDIVVDGEELLFAYKFLRYLHYWIKQMDGIWVRSLPGWRIPCSSLGDLHKLLLRFYPAWQRKQAATALEAPELTFKSIPFAVTTDPLYYLVTPAVRDPQVREAINAIDGEWQGEHWCVPRSVETCRRIREIAGEKISESRRRAKEAEATTLLLSVNSELSVFTEDECYRVRTGSYDKHLVELFNNWHGRWDGQCWFIPRSGQVAKVLALLIEVKDKSVPYQSKSEEEKVEWDRQCIDHARLSLEGKHGAIYVAVEDEHWAVSFDYDESIVQLVKIIDGRRFDGVTKQWFVLGHQWSALKRLLSQIAE